MDRIDRNILAALQGDARLTVAELATRVALTPSPCWRRVKRLEDEGYITGYRATLSPERLGFGVTAFVSVMMESHARDLGGAFEARIAEIPEIIACHNVSGRYDFLLEVVAPDLKSFGEFARDVLRAIPGVKEIYSSFSLKALKAARELPLPPAVVRN
jgi:DNA-binding Lrp family transcriptional regulator